MSEGLPRPAWPIASIKPAGDLIEVKLLLVGAPGLAKTKLAITLGTVLGLEEKRIQFTPDLMPADIVGSEVLDEAEAGRHRFRFVKGPVFWGKKKCHICHQHIEIYQKKVVSTSKSYSDLCDNNTFLFSF